MTRKAIVTGASRGLGAALVAQLSEDHWDVLPVSRHAEERVDLTSAEEITAWLATGRLAGFLAEATEVLLINNAGTAAPIGPSGTLDAGEIWAAVQLNIAAPILLTDAVLAARPPAADLRIVHISSGAGRRPIAGWAVYCATKAAVDMHARALAAENLPGVRIAAIAPGVVDTDMQGLIRAADFPGRDRFVNLKASGRLSSPAEAAAGILRLVADAAFGDEPIADVRG